MSRFSSGRFVSLPDSFSVNTFSADMPRPVRREKLTVKVLVKRTNAGVEVGSHFSSRSFCDFTF